MKTRLSRVWGMTLTILALPLAGGCLQDASSAQGTRQAVGVTNPISSNGLAAATELPATTNAEPVAIPVEEDPLANAPIKPFAAPAVVAPANTSPAAAEVVKLANSGVDEGVMLAYVTNSTSRFDLSADDIVYLNDLGVPPAVVTAMIQRDQVSGVGPAVPLAPVIAQPAQAVTNYAGPNPADVAPQALAPADISQAGATAPPTQAVDNNTFYTALAPYGTWMEVEGYGMVWQPTVTVVNPSWRPYYDSGRWVWTDAGYYWVSDYSWGWAPFHYGRWFRHYRAGWCWAPDTVWGPSWVSWRYDSDYCGWAPLPPSAYYRPGFGFYYYDYPVSWGFSFGLGYSSYSFVHFSHFHSHHLHHHHVDKYHCERVYNHGKHGSWKNDRHYPRPINEGPGVDTVSRHTRVQKVALREQPASRGGQQGGRFPSGRAERLEGKTLTVYRPEVAPLPSPTTTLAAGGSSRRMPNTGKLGLAPAANGSSRPGSSLADRGSIAPPLSSPSPAPADTVASSLRNNGGSRSGSSLVNRDALTASKPATVPNRAPAVSSSDPFPSGSARLPSQRLPERPDSTSLAKAPAASPVAPTTMTPGKPSTSPGRSPNRLVQSPGPAPARTPEASPSPAPVKPEVAASIGSTPAASSPSTGARREFPGSRLAERPSVAPSPVPAPVTRPGTATLPGGSRSVVAQPPAPAPSAPSAMPAPQARPESSGSPLRSRSSLSAGSSSTYNPAPSVAAPAPAPGYGGSSRTPAPSVSAPSYSSIRPQTAPAPSYSAPRPQSPPTSAPRPTYSAPSRPTPSYSAPARMPSAPAPAPTIRAPSPSYSAPSPAYSAPSRTPSAPAPAPSYSAPSAPRSMPSASAPSRSADSGSSRSGRGGGSR